MRIFFPLFLILASLLCQSASATTLKIATVSPDGTSWMRTMRAAGKEIQRRTEGRVDLRFFPGGVMGNDRSVMRKIRAGQLHGGAVTGGALGDIAHDANVYGLPFLFRNLDEVDRVRREFDPVIAERLKDQGMISFGFAEGGFSYVMSRQPVRSLADLGQRKVWAPEGDEISEIAFDTLGISPISLPLTDVLTALQTGLIDTVAASPVGAIALQWHTRIRYVTDLPLTYVYGALVISDKAFGRLSPTDQAVVQQVLGDAFQALDAQSRRDNIGARAALEQQGIDFLTPAGRDRDGWERSIDKSMESLNEHGYFTPGLMHRVRASIQDSRSGQTPAGS